MECSIYRIVAVFAWGRPYPGLWRLESDSCCDSWSFNWCNLETATLSLRGSTGIISRGSALPSSLCTRQQIWVMYIRLIVPSSLSGIITSSTWHEISELRWDERASIDRRVVVVFFSSFCFLFLLLLLLLLLFFLVLLNNFSCFHTTFTCECDVWRLLSSPPAPASLAGGQNDTFSPPSPLLCELMSRPL